MPVSQMSLPRHVLHDLGFFGYYLHVHAGGRSGQKHILTRLYKSGGHMTQRDLQEAAGISSASISEVLSKLESGGLICRTRSDEDRRQLDIALTQEGSDRAEQIIGERHAFEDRCLACLDAQEQQQLVELLDRLVDHWKKSEGEEACS